ncbi:nuclear transport factor 2 family protein [Cnuibacter physcomitrellae]|uniref:nuclear transport factor 2 family protein n=1 Tax=Cnuibacter physcomitrellae TaxID=1619308 RepID=UPI0021761153|nr:nuclear transport factor 2 family protein [Cnuibacter physcomitrellae]MCS5498293.1 nuclear transport factor 2 family protein [Cnuibacter physcomitrellae]
MTGFHGSLEDSIRAFSDALTRSDIEAAKEFAADDFTVVSLDGGLKVLDRAWWEAMVPNFTLESIDLRTEIIVERDDHAIDYRYAAMTSRVGSAERTGLFCITDHWQRTDERGWLVWQRHSVPVVDSSRLPDEF